MVVVKGVTKQIDNLLKHKCRFLAVIWEYSTNGCTPYTSLYIPTFHGTKYNLTLKSLMDSCRGFPYFFNNYGDKSSGIEGNVAFGILIWGYDHGWIAWIPVTMDHRSSCIDFIWWRKKQTATEDGCTKGRAKHHKWGNPFFGHVQEIQTSGSV